MLVTQHSAAYGNHRKKVSRSSLLGRRIAVSSAQKLVIFMNDVDSQQVLEFDIDWCIVDTVMRPWAASQLICSIFRET